MRAWTLQRLMVLWQSRSGIASIQTSMIDTEWEEVGHERHYVDAVRRSHRSVN